MSLKEKKQKINVELPPNASLLVLWSEQGIGFGEMWIGMKDKRLVIDYEGRSKEYAKKILCQLVDDAEEIRYSTQR